MPDFYLSVTCSVVPRCVAARLVVNRQELARRSFNGSCDASTLRRESFPHDRTKATPTGQRVLINELREKFAILKIGNVVRRF